MSQNCTFDLQNKHQVCQIIWRQGLFCKKHLLKLQKKNFTWNCDKMASPKTRRVLAELRPRDENDVSLVIWRNFYLNFWKMHFWTFTNFVGKFLGNVISRFIFGNLMIFMWKCENSRIFLSLRFYVKSKFHQLETQNLRVFHI